MKIRENIKISELTTMRLGGEAKYVLDVEEHDEARGAYTFAREKKLPVYVLGGGANTIGRDEGFDGIIIRNKITGFEVLAESIPQEITNKNGDKTTVYDLQINEDVAINAENYEELIDEFNKLQNNEAVLMVYGGEVWNDFVEWVANKKYTGIEALAAIPGTVGAAPVQNIGAYGQEISQTLFAVEVYDTLSNEYRILFNDELDFSYRHSIFNDQQFGRFFIVSAMFKLHKGTIIDPDENGNVKPLYNSLQSYIDENGIDDYSPFNIAEAVAKIRADKLPDPEEIASSGSFFKNVYLDESQVESAKAKGVPIRESEKFDAETGEKTTEYKVNTGWLVQNCGLLGKDLHGMKINEKAALVLINDHAKSYADLAAAREEICNAVKEKFDIKIEQEPVEIEQVKK